MCALAHTYTLHPHIDTLTVGSRRREAKCPALLLWSVDVLSSYKDCDTNVDCPRHSLSLYQSSQCLILPFLFSLFPSLHLSLPHCPQLHLFLSTLQMIAGSFPSSSRYSSPASALPPLTLSLCPFSLALSAFHKCLFFIVPAVHCQLRGAAQATGCGVRWRQPRCTFIACLKKRKEKERQRETRKEVKEHFQRHYCLQGQWWLLTA